MKSITARQYQSTASEAAIQRAICDWLNLIGVPYTVSDASITRGKDGRPRRKVTTAGWPDITAVLPGSGRLWAIEVKSSSGKLRPAQSVVLDKLGNAGALVTVAHGLEDVVRDYDLRGERKSDTN